MLKDCYLVFLLFFFAFVNTSCSHKVNRVVHQVPSIRVQHQGHIITVDLESYVASVLAGEVSPSWPKSALQAQAVAARTFAILRMRERKNQPFHVQSSVMDQVYKNHKVQAFTEAAKATSGQVLFYDNRLAETSFHSTCGGKTTDSHSIWGRPYQHLKGVTCDNCKSSNTYNWKENISLQEIESKLKQKISEIKISSRSSDGRVQTIEILGAASPVRMSGHELRMMLGPMKMKSTLLSTIKVIKDKLQIAGRGFGHGVGMCQYGALGLAKKGKRYQDILAYYYPGTYLKALY